MLEPINEASSTSFQAAYVRESSTKVKGVQDCKPDMNVTTVARNQEKQSDENKIPEGNVKIDERLKEALDKINLDERFRRTGCEFTYHEVSNRFSITLFDKKTKEVLKEIPPEETIKMIDKLYELAGLIVDERL